MFQEENNSDLDQCIHNVIETLFDKEDSLLVFSLVNRSCVLPNSIRNPLMRTKTLHKTKKPTNVGMGIVLYFDDLQILQVSALSRDILPYANADANTKWLLITPSPNFTDYLEIFWKVDLVQVVVLVYSRNKNDTSMRLYTSNPQDPSNICGRAANLIHVQNCKSKLTFNFPNVLRKYTNCSFTFYTEYPVHDKRQLGYNKFKYFVSLITSRLDTKLLFSTTKNSGFKCLIEFDFLRNVYNKQISSVIYSETVIWAVPKPKQMSTIRAITIIFDNAVWFSLLVSFLITSLSWWLILKLKNTSVKSKSEFALILLNMLQSTLFGSVYKMSSFWTLRFLIITYIIYSIHIQTLFISKMLESLTVPKYERGIKNLNDLSESKLPIIVNRKLFDTIFSNKNIKDDNHSEAIYNAIIFVEGEIFADRFFDCIKKDECDAFLVGNEDYLNTTFFEVSHTIKDNSVTGNFDYTFVLNKYCYTTATIEKISYILFESGITNDFGQISEIEVSKNGFNRRPKVLRFLNDTQNLATTVTKINSDISVDFRI
ncbi:hypothetical protein FQR65_LT13267 [Abscondita terminalis]|nr:hypothetical protein FQR65_LT13267 [Abscondita terminalis]